MNEQLRKWAESVGVLGAARALKSELTAILEGRSKNSEAVTIRNKTPLEIKTEIVNASSLSFSVSFVEKKNWDKISKGAVEIRMEIAKALEDDRQSEEKIYNSLVDRELQLLGAERHDENYKFYFLLDSSGNYAASSEFSSRMMSAYVRKKMALERKSK